MSILDVFDDYDYWVPPGPNQKVTMPLLEQLKKLARSMNIPSGWWIVGLVHNETIIKVACFLGEHTARDWGYTHKGNLGYLVTKL